MPTFLIAAISFSLAYFAAPGPITTEALRRGLRGGPGSALRFQLGALAADAAWVCLGLLSAAAVAAHRPTQLALGLLGVGLLGRLAWGSLADAWSGRLPATSWLQVDGDWLAGALLGLANPFTATFWLGAGSGVIFGGTTITPLRLLAVLAAFLLSGLLYTVVLTALIACGHRRVTPAQLRWVNALCGLALAGFALRLLAQSLTLA